jgi:hypothetical protein
MFLLFQNMIWEIGNTIFGIIRVMCLILHEFFGGKRKKKKIIVI